MTEQVPPGKGESMTFTLDGLMFTEFAAHVAGEWDRVRSGRETASPQLLAHNPDYKATFLIEDDSARDAIDAAVRLIVSAAAAGEQTPFRMMLAHETQAQAKSGVEVLRRFTDDANRCAKTVLDLQGRQVRRLRSLRVPWRDIGEALRMTSQSAQQKARDNFWLVDDQEDS